MGLNELDFWLIKLGLWLWIHWDRLRDWFLVVFEIFGFFGNRDDWLLLNSEPGFTKLLGAFGDAFSEFGTREIEHDVRLIVVTPRILAKKKSGQVLGDFGNDVSVQVTQPVDKIFGVSLLTNGVRRRSQILNNFWQPICSELVSDRIEMQFFPGPFESFDHLLRGKIKTPACHLISKFFFVSFHHA